jgi:hypothetical protein
VQFASAELHADGMLQRYVDDRGRPGGDSRGFSDSELESMQKVQVQQNSLLTKRPSGVAIMVLVLENTKKFSVPGDGSSTP